MNLRVYRRLLPWNMMCVGQGLILTSNHSVKTIWVPRESVLMVNDNLNDIKIIQISISLSHSLIPDILAQ